MPNDDQTHSQKPVLEHRPAELPRLFGEGAWFSGPWRRVVSLATSNRLVAFSTTVYALFAILSWHAITRTNVVMQRQLRAMEQQPRVTERPWLARRMPSEISSDPAKPWQFLIVNVGKSPALKVSLHWDARVGPNPLSQQEFGGASQTTPESLVVPGDIMTFTKTDPDGTPQPLLSQAEANLAKERNGIINVYGRITYCDQFGSGYTEEFCNRFRASGMSLGICQEFNTWREDPTVKCGQSTR